LMKDGRKSLRQIAREIGVSTPTVESRFKRMVNTGFIKKIAPILDTDKVELGISALLFTKVLATKALDIAKQLSEFEEVRNIFTTSGDNNMILRVTVDKPESLEALVRKKISVIDGVKSVSSQLITRVVKDEQNVIVKPGLALNLTCNYCRGEIPKEPKTLRFGEYERYFCCSSCLTLYKEKYKGRIRALSR
ncbi:MAG: Lrp/AsnC ligand binding domain-containing protein, partial [Nitrososphaerales archaeon]